MHLPILLPSVNNNLLVDMVYGHGHVFVFVLVACFLRIHAGVSYLLPLLF